MLNYRQSLVIDHVGFEMKAVPARSERRSRSFNTEHEFVSWGKRDGIAGIERSRLETGASPFLQSSWCQVDFRLVRLLAIGPTKSRLNPEWRPKRPRRASVREYEVSFDAFTHEVDHVHPVGWRRRVVITKVADRQHEGDNLPVPLGRISEDTREKSDDASDGRMCHRRFRLCECTTLFIPSILCLVWYRIN